MVVLTANSDSQVRELLSAQYEQRRLSIVDAMDEVLGHVNASSGLGMAQISLLQSFFAQLCHE